MLFFSNIFTSFHLLDSIFLSRTTEAEERRREERKREKRAKKEEKEARRKEEEEENWTTVDRGSAATHMVMVSTSLVLYILF